MVLFVLHPNPVRHTQGLMSRSCPFRPLFFTGGSTAFQEPTLKFSDQSEHNSALQSRNKVRTGQQPWTLTQQKALTIPKMFWDFISTITKSARDQLEYIWPLVCPESQCLPVQVPPVGNSGSVLYIFGISYLFVVEWYSIRPYSLQVPDHMTPAQGISHRSVALRSPPGSGGSAETCGNTSHKSSKFQATSTSIYFKLIPTP